MGGDCATHPRRNANINNTIRALRAKATDPSVTTAEAVAFATKADELAKRYFELA